jgi:hypothetical protein
MHPMNDPASIRVLGFALIAIGCVLCYWAYELITATGLDRLGWLALVGAAFAFKFGYNCFRDGPADLY